jgi:hypothetical protein
VQMYYMWGKPRCLVIIYHAHVSVSMNELTVSISYWLEEEATLQYNAYMTSMPTGDRHNTMHI